MFDSLKKVTRVKRKLDPMNILKAKIEVMGYADNIFLRS